MKQNSLITASEGMTAGWKNMAQFEREEIHGDRIGYSLIVTMPVLVLQSRGENLI